MIHEDLKRAFFDANDGLQEYNANPKPFGQFKKLNKDVFYKYVAPVAKYYRKSSIYDDPNISVIFHMQYGLLRPYVTMGVSFSKEEIDYTCDISISKKAKDRDIDEYAYTLVSRLMDRK